MRERNMPSATAPRDDEALMAAYVAGDTAAFGELFQRYARFLMSLLAAQPGARNEAADLVQQTFLQIHRARHDFDPARKLRPWVVTIALNLCREHCRRRARHPEVSLELEGLPEPWVENRKERQVDASLQLRQALTALRPEQREVIELRWLAGLSFSEVANIMGVSAAAARVRAHRAYLALRRADDVQLDNAGRGHHCTDRSVQLMELRRNR
jgi:RNA polymerase sigma-70 factor (ECF subfamily)